VKLKKSEPLHFQAYQILRKKILSGEIKPGERLLEMKLSAYFGISRSPVREAMRMLEQDGLIVSSGTGQIVHSMEYEDIKEVYECRMATESFAAYLATDNISSNQIKQLKSNLKNAKDLYSRGLNEKAVELNTIFHNTIIGACGNKRLQELIDKTSSLVIMAYNNNKEFIRKSDYLNEHERIINALENRNKNEAESLMKIHIENDWQYYLDCHNNMFRRKSKLMPNQDDIKVCFEK